MVSLCWLDFRGVNVYLQCSKVNDIVDIGVLLKHLLESSFVCDVCLVELRPLPADELNAVDDFFRRIVEVIHNYDLVIGLEEGQCREGANVARSSRSYLALASQEAIDIWTRVPSHKNRSNNHGDLMCEERIEV